MRVFECPRKDSQAAMSVSVYACTSLHTQSGVGRKSLKGKGVRPTLVNGPLTAQFDFKWARPLNLLRGSLPFFQCEEVHPFTVMIKKNTWHEKYITVILTVFPNAHPLQFNFHLQSHKIFSGRSFWNSAADKKGVSALNNRSRCLLKVHCILKDSSPLPICCLNVSPQANISGPSKHDGLHD